MNSTSLLDTLLSHNLLLSMWGALILHWFFPLQNSHYHPMTLWTHSAQTINEKVNHRHYPIKQQQLSGTLGFLLLWLTTALFLISLEMLSGYECFFDVVLLWFALGWKPFFVFSAKLQKFLLKAQKPAARILMTKIVKRDTSTLTSVELTKLSCETLLVGYARNLINVLFFYALAGGIGAFLYTLLMQLSREWSPRLPAYRYFGASVAKLLAIAEWFTTRFFALFLVTGRGFFRSLQAVKIQPYQSNSEFIWSVVGSKYQIALGGPAVYEDEQIVRAVLGGDVLPCATHFVTLNQNLILKSFIYIGAQSFIMLILFI